MPVWIALIAALLSSEPAGPPATPPPATVPPPAIQVPAPATPGSAAANARPKSVPDISETVDLRPVYQVGDTMKIRWTSDNVDVREGERIAEKQKRSSSHTELTFTIKIEQVFPDRVYRCSATMDRVVIEAPTMAGIERYDSKEPATAQSVFASPARILMKKPIEFAISGETMSFFRKEHPRLRAWYEDGVNLLDNTFGDDAFPARFGVLFGWRTDSASVGKEWKDSLPIRINSGYSIITDRTFALTGNDGITMDISVTGVGKAAPDSAKRGQIFRSSTYDGTYKANTASAKIREGNIVHTYTADYQWQGAPASVTTTVIEKIERLE
ncbi:MAG: hypothetical protein JNK16_04935 [Phycisphaerales bacterium]|nr:hypothetical protein [Phycisphaerales bacterium]